MSHTLDVLQVPAEKVQLEALDLEDAQRRAGAAPAAALLVQVFVASEAKGQTVAARLNDIGDCCPPSLAISHPHLRDRALSQPHLMLPGLPPPLARQHAGIACVSVVYVAEKLPKLG